MSLEESHLFSFFIRKFLKTQTTATEHKVFTYQLNFLLQPLQK